MQKTYAIILAGGRGLRLERDLPKQFIKINNRPIIAWSLEKFNKLSEISGIIAVIPGDYRKNLEDIIKKYRISKMVKIVNGGAMRQESSYNGLSCMSFDDDDILVIHDAARPFISSDIIKNCIIEARAHGASGAYIKTTDTLAEAKGDFVKKIPLRSGFYRAQTPQCFKYKIIKKAHQRALKKNMKDATDDVQLVIAAGQKVRIVEGHPDNIKITTQTDLEIAGLIAGRIGSDVL